MSFFFMVVSQRTSTWLCGWDEGRLPAARAQTTHVRTRQKRGLERLRERLNQVERIEVIRGGGATSPSSLRSAGTSTVTTSGASVDHLAFPSSPRNSPASRHLSKKKANGFYTKTYPGWMPLSNS